MVDVRCARCCEGEDGAKAVVWERMVVRKMEVAVMNFMVGFGLLLDILMFRNLIGRSQKMFLTVRGNLYCQLVVIPFRFWCLFFV